MARTPIEKQGTFGPAQSRARVFSTFAPARLNREAGRGAANLSEALGTVAQGVGAQEVADAEKEREQGLQDYVAGLVEDGQRINNGELEPIESRYYMAGVEMGQGRRRGREAWAAFTEWKAENPRPGLSDNPDETYEEWLERGLAESQASVGIDPDNMTENQFGEYAGIINQLRQRDGEEYIAQLNQESRQNNLETIRSDIFGLSQSFDADNPEATYQSAASIMSRARVLGMDLSAVRQEIVTNFANIARETGDVSILENMPTSGDMAVLMDTSTMQARDRAVTRVEAQIEADRLEGQTAALQAVQDALQADDFSGARGLLDAARDAGTISDESYLGWDQAVHGQREAHELQLLAEARRAAEDRRRENLEAANEQAENAAIADAYANGTLAAGVTYRDAEGVTQTLTPDEVATRQDASIFDAMGRTPEALAHLSYLVEENGVVSPAVQNYYKSILDIPLARLESGDLTPRQQSSVEFLAQMNMNTLSSFVSDDEAAIIRTTRFMYQTGDYDAGEALHMARQIQRHTPSDRLVSRHRNFVEDRLDDRTGTWIWQSQYGNLDRDTPATRRWSANLARATAAIEETVGREAALEYRQSVVDNAMVVNRQPVNPIGPLGGEQGTEFLESLMVTVGRDYLVPELDRSYGDNFVNDILGWSGEFDPFDPETFQALSGEIDVENVEGGLRFHIEGESVYLTNQDILGIYSAWQSEADQRAAQRESLALEDSLRPGLRDRAQEAFHFIMDQQVRTRDSLIDN